uniref:Uncharacterized protein n=1 Tax=Romanomermis culicivorax TaxID=13658 RepID=A0A915I948_ROMCU
MQEHNDFQLHEESTIMSSMMTNSVTIISKLKFPVGKNKAEKCDYIFQTANHSTALQDMGSCWGYTKDTPVWGTRLLRNLRGLAKELAQTDPSDGLERRAEGPDLDRPNELTLFLTQDLFSRASSFKLRPMVKENEISNRTIGTNLLENM